MADPYQIQGQIPFGAGGNALAGAQGGLAGLAQQYQTGYNSALAQNQAMYENILKGYQGVMQGQQTAQGAISGGYSQLYNNVLTGIQGVGDARGQDIRDTYTAQRGAMGQSMIDRGLGNTTIADVMQRGITSDEQKAQNSLAEQIAQLRAGYQSQLGLAGLGQAERGSMANTGLAGQQLNWMNSVTSKYPNSAEYNALFAMQGQGQQAAADRALMQQLGQRGGAVATPGGGGVNWNQGASIGGGARIPDVRSLSPGYSSYGSYGGGGAMVYPSGDASPWGSTTNYADLPGAGGTVYDTSGTGYAEGYDPYYGGGSDYSAPSGYGQGYSMPGSEQVYEDIPSLMPPQELLDELLDEYDYFYF